MLLWLGCSIDLLAILAGSWPTCEWVYLPHLNVPDLHFLFTHVRRYLVHHQFFLRLVNLVPQVICLFAQSFLDKLEFNFPSGLIEQNWIGMLKSMIGNSVVFCLSQRWRTYPYLEQTWRNWFCSGREIAQLDGSLQSFLWWASAFVTVIFSGATLLI